MQRYFLTVCRSVESLTTVPIEGLATIALSGVPGAQLIRVARQTLTEAEVSFVVTPNRAALLAEVKDRLSQFGLTWVSLNWLEAKDGPDLNSTIGS